MPLGKEVIEYLDVQSKMIHEILTNKEKLNMYFDIKKLPRVYPNTPTEYLLAGLDDASFMDAVMKLVKREVPEWGSCNSPKVFCSPFPYPSLSKVPESRDNLKKFLNEYQHLDKTLLDSCCYDVGLNQKLMKKALTLDWLKSWLIKAVEESTSYQMQLKTATCGGRSII